MPLAQTFRSHIIARPFIIIAHPLTPALPFKELYTLVSTSLFMLDLRFLFQYIEDYTYHLKKRMHQRKIKTIAIFNTSIKSINLSQRTLALIFSLLFLFQHIEDCLSESHALFKRHNYIPADFIIKSYYF